MTEKILFVDDETSIRDLVGRFLPAAGYEVTLATNGKEALLRHEVASCTTERQ
jgi:CheY-like chemotaxis protein